MADSSIKVNFLLLPFSEGFSVSKKEVTIIYNHNNAIIIIIIIVILKNSLPHHRKHHHHPISDVKLKNN